MEVPEARGNGVRTYCERKEGDAAEGGAWGDKKAKPLAQEQQGALKNLWRRPTFPHDVMQYHRRWRA